MFDFRSLVYSISALTTFTLQQVLLPEVEATLLPNHGTTDWNDGCAAELVDAADWPSGVLDSVTIRLAAPEEIPEDDLAGGPSTKRLTADRRSVKDPSSLGKKAVSSNSSCNHTASGQPGKLVASM